MPAMGNVESPVAQSTLIVELLCFLVLALITIFRKKLSSNDGYRNEARKSPDEIITSNATSTRGRTATCSVGAESHCNNAQSKLLAASLGGSICLSSVLLDENILLNVVNYLADADIGQLASSSKCLHRDCTADFIWEQLWMLTFGVMWCDDDLAEIRRIRGILWNPMNDLAPESGTIQASSGLSLDLKKNHNLRPVQGWLRFYLEFEFCWMDWLMAGCCTPEYCLIGLYGSLYNISNFLPDHPGSSESLTEASGGDGTDIFSDIGHSSFAATLADMFLLWGIGDKAKHRQAKQMRTPQIVRQYWQLRPNRFQVKMKRDRFFAEKLILRDNHIVKDIKFVSKASASQALVMPITTVIEDSQAGDGTETDPDRAIEGHSAALEGQMTETNTTSWPMGINLNLKMNLSLNTALRLDNLSSPSSLQKSVVSIAESIFLAKAKASNFLKRGFLSTRLRDETPMRSMAPSLFEKRERCSPGCKHTGRLRMLYDPLERQWWGWWTCCGQGELAIDIREEEMLCAEMAEQKMAYKIC